MSNPFNMKYDEEYEYIQLPKHLYDEIVKAQSREEQEKLFFKEIENRKFDIRNEIENLEEDVLRFKAVGVRYKNELEKVYEEQYKSLDELWCKMNLEDLIYSKLKDMNKQLTYFKNDIKDINSSISNVNTYKLEKVIELLQTFNRLSEDDKSIVKYLLENKTT